MVHMSLQDIADTIGLQYQDIGNGQGQPPLNVENLIAQLESYSTCMPAPHRAQHIMAEAARLLRAANATT